MISLSKYRANLFQIWDIQRKTGLTIKVYHRRKVYEVTIKPTYEKVVVPYKKQPNNKKQGINPHTLTYEDCQACGSMLVNGICLNQRCPAVLSAKESQSLPSAR